MGSAALEIVGVPMEGQFLQRRLNRGPTSLGSRKLSGSPATSQVVGAPMENHFFLAGKSSGSSATFEVVWVPASLEV